jgi:type II secretory pathway pseudopilin PulG
MRRSDTGFQLPELLTVMGCLAITVTLAVPPFLRLSGALRVRLGAAEVTAALRTARSFAILRGVNVAVKFRTAPGGVVTFALYRDGDGDGVANQDIDSGVDPQMVPARPLAHLGRQVRFGFPEGTPPRDPGDPRRRLDRLDDPIRFNTTDLASFNPLGGSTPGSIYLTDGRALAVVRVLGVTGRVRVLEYDGRAERWR